MKVVSTEELEKKTNLFFIDNICKSFYFNDLHLKRQNSADVDSVKYKKDKDLTHLTFVNHA